MDLKDATNIPELARRATIVWQDVCDYHYDHTVMDQDGTCGECKDDLHEAEIWARP